ncbi:cytochrome c biogenesis protein CcmG, thiol:disulfide interchange protein DsbE [Bryocella elongata]|uniref:Cytochrome c biogenesis protein CcmG, thiol:disulfide interchange protein DsbE n=1 Tax=Bryocella elongata TaxID=863522 RepID=A0A1H5ZB81_9BACT|nr:TlpA disulfide reductase family protein [Bryocella elongata]SEG33324.1 cytochrome c biogenesis protein CcmG, thiol:disulfide interchange protein DsbE [Bryocella elongata]
MPQHNATATGRSEPRKGTGRVTLLLFLTFVGFEVWKTIHFRAPKQIDVVQLHLRDLRGAPISNATFAGKAVLLNYWAPWCGPCKLELPWLAQLQREHADDLVIVGIVDDPQDYQDAVAYMQSKGATYPLAQLSPEMHDAVGDMHTVPTTFYLSRNGHVMHSINGVVPETVLKHWVNEIIAAQ